MSSKKEVSDDDLKQGDWYVLFDDGETYSSIGGVGLMCITDEVFEEHEPNFKHMPSKKVIGWVSVGEVFSEYLVSHGYTPLEGDLTANRYHYE